MYIQSVNTLHEFSSDCTMLVSLISGECLYFDCPSQTRVDINGGSSSSSPTTFTVSQQRGIWHSDKGHGGDPASLQYSLLRNQCRYRNVKASGLLRSGIKRGAIFEEESGERDKPSRRRINQ